MKKEIAEKWVKALRSGEYKQTKNVLKDNDGFCCLGVLCDISKNDLSRDISSVDWAWDHSKQTNRFLLEYAHIPHEVLEWSGMGNSTGRYDPIHPSLTALNDRGHSFNQIADIIEKIWKEL